MAYTKESIESILRDLATTINISDEMFKKADDEYTSLGSWIDKYTKKDATYYSVHIYPQGSFALGTVVRPISDEDDYDLDLVCQVENGSALSAEQLKVGVVEPWLTSYKKTKSDIEEKRRCWHVEYEDVPNFHMDVIPAIPRYSDDIDNTMISITDKDSDRIPIYEYQGSNPKGYVEWFFGRCRQRKVKNMSATEINAMARQEDLRQNKYKTNLQKAIQILKRHRDIMFEKDPDNKPISIIITTIAGQVYSGENSILDTLLGFVDGVEIYLNANKKEDGSYSIPNPSYAEEDFADKWKDHPERKAAFFSWLKRLKEDFDLQSLMMRDRVAMGSGVKKCFGSISGAAIFSKKGFEESKEVKEGTLKINTLTGNLMKTGTVVVPPSRHYGEE
ncbi:MAG: nucleotidyltransferase [Eubacteriales bacterium]